MARDQYDNAQKLLEAARLMLNGDYEGAERKAEKMVKQAQKLHDDYVAKQKVESEMLNLQLRQLKNSALNTAVVTAEGALELAKNNNIAFRAA